MTVSRVSVFVAIFLAAVMCFTVLAACIRPVKPGVYIDECALVQYRDSTVCR